MKTIKARVRDGAAFLDEFHPGWENEIDLNTLSLSNACRCVLGQLVKNIDPQASFYDVAADECGYPVEDQSYAKKLGFARTLNYREAAGKGFHLPDSLLGRSGYYWRKLTAEWRRVIEARRAER